MYCFYHLNKINDKSFEVEVSCNTDFAYTVADTNVMFVKQIQIYFPTMEQTLHFFYNAVTLNTGMVYNMHTFLDLLSDRLNYDLPRLPQTEFWTMVESQFESHGIWNQMWGQESYYTDDDKSYEDDEDDDEDYEEEEEDEEEEDEDYEEDYEEEDEDYEEEDEDEDGDEDDEKKYRWNPSSNLTDKKLRNAELEAFKIRQLVYNPERRRERCNLCHSHPLRTKSHLMSNIHLQMVAAMSNRNMDLTYLM